MAGFMAGFAEQLSSDIEQRNKTLDRLIEDNLENARIAKKGYAERNNQADQVLKSAEAIRSKFGLEDTQALALAEAYGADLPRLQATLDKENDRLKSSLGVNYTAEDVMSYVNVASNLNLPKGVDLADGVQRLMGLNYQELAKETNPKSEGAKSRSFIRAAFAFDPQLQAAEKMEDMKGPNGLTYAQLLEMQDSGFSQEDVFGDVTRSGGITYDYTDTTAKTTRNDYSRRLSNKIFDADLTDALVFNNYTAGDDQDKAKLKSNVHSAGDALSRLERSIVLSFRGTDLAMNALRKGVLDDIYDRVDSPEELQSLVNSVNTGNALSILEAKNGKLTNDDIDAIIGGSVPTGGDDDALIVSEVVPAQPVTVVDGGGSVVTASGQGTRAGTEEVTITKAPEPISVVKSITDSMLVGGGESVTTAAEDTEKPSLMDRAFRMSTVTDVPDLSGMEARFQKWIAPLMTPASDQVPDGSMDKIPKNDSWKNSSYLLPRDAEKLSKSVLAGEATGDFLQEVWDKGNTDFGVAIDIGNAGLAYGLASVIDFGKGVLGIEVNTTSEDTTEKSLMSPTRGLLEMDFSERLKEQGDFYSQRASDIATMGWKDYVEAQTKVEVPEVVLEEVKSGFDTEVFTAVGVKTKNGELSYEEFAGFVPEFPGDVPLSLRTQAQDPSMPSKVMTTVKSLMAPTRGLMEMEMPSSEDLQAAITERTGQIPENYKKQIATSINSFNETLKDFEDSVNVFVPNAIDAVSSATLSGVDNINDRLKSIETVVNETMDAEVDKRVPAFEELKRQFSELTLFPSKKEGTIDTGPNTITDTQFDTDEAVLEFFSPERNAVRKRIIFDILGIEPDLLDTTPLPEPEVSEILPSIMAKPVDTSKKTGTVSKPNTRMPQDPAIEAEQLVVDTEDMRWLPSKPAERKKQKALLLKALVQNKKKPLSFKSREAAEAWAKANSSNLPVWNVSKTLFKRFPSK